MIVQALLAFTLHSGPCQGQWKTEHQVKQGITCVFKRFDSDQIHGALNVANCESSFYPQAKNGNYEGLFQLTGSRWSAYFKKWILNFPLRKSWGLKNSTMSGRSNAIITALMVRNANDTWKGWSCRP